MIPSLGSICIRFDIVEKLFYKCNTQGEYDFYLLFWYFWPTTYPVVIIFVLA